MKKIALLFIFLMGAFYSHAQINYFKKVIYPGSSGNLVVRKIIKTADNGYIAVSSSVEHSFNNLLFQGAAVSKLDSTGTLLWNFNVGQVNNEDIYDAVATPDSGAVLVGTALIAFPPTTLETTVIKLNRLGNILWTKVDTLTNIMGSQLGLSILPTNDGNYFVQSGDMFVLYKISPSGIQLSVNHYASSGGFWILTAFKIPNGNIVDLMNNLIVVLDSVGHMIQKFNVICPLSNFMSNCIIRSSDSGYIITGNFNFSGDLSPNSVCDSAVVIRTDSSFSVLWSKIYYHQHLNITAVTETEAGNLIFLGNNVSGSGNYLVVMKTDSAGNILQAFENDNFTLGRYLERSGKQILIGGGYDFPSSVPLVVSTDTSFSNMCIHSISINAFPVSVSISPLSIEFANLWDSHLENYTISPNLYSNSFNECIPTSVESASKDIVIELGPNPVTNELTIEKGESKIETAEVYDVVGKKCLTTNIQQRSTINVSSLAPGIYFVRVTDEKGNKIAKKFVKM